ncbi:putative membrane-anchored protein [Staphylococcus caledonicus]
MKSTAKLTRENNVKSLRLNNTDREIFENYITYVRADLRVNPHDSELMLSRILKRLLAAEDEGTLALEFFEHNPRAHAEKEIKSLPNETFQNIIKYICRNFIFLIGIFCFFKGFIGFFIGGNNNEVYLYTFPLIVIAGLFIIFLFILVIFKTVQLQSFNNSHWVWWFNYCIIALLLVALFYVFFIPQSFLAFGPFILISNWSFIILSLIITPTAFYIEHHFGNKNSNTVL